MNPKKFMTSACVLFRQPGLPNRHLLVVCAAILASNLFAAEAPRVPAFPGAEGYGAVTRGGRGGRVIAVTNINDSGPGSLRAAVEAKGPRIVVFKVSGTITLEDRLRITNPYITIAGQTAPGDGVTIRKYQLQIDADDVVIRYIRARLGDESGDDADAISGRYHKNIILDHLSASWSVDEAVSFYRNENVTIQWCLIAESLYKSNHVKGHHGFGGIWGGHHTTYHHNLLAHHSSRNPRFSSGCGNTDFRNNVIFNWGYNSGYGGEEREEDDRPELNHCVINMVGNYYKPGPATVPGEVSHRIVNPYSSNRGFAKWFIAENFMHGNAAVTADNWDGGVHPQKGQSGADEIRLMEPWPSMPLHGHSAEEAYRAVLRDAGATVPKRDEVDIRIVEETRRGTATYEGTGYERDRQVAEASKASGIIDSPDDVGGWPQLKSLPAPPDSDSDGMPDEWEERYGLDPRKAAEASADKDADGYTDTEEYINGTDPTEFVDYTKPENNTNTL
jgi:hypothetical protein